MEGTGFYYSEFMPEWRNWYTHQTQNLAGFTSHVGSSPTSGTKKISGLWFSPEAASLFVTLKCNLLPSVIRRQAGVSIIRAYTISVTGNC